MPKAVRLLLIFAALLLACTPLLPIWRISLIAPQYPEGMGMQIRFHTIEGVKENDLDNINHLNHYIGMRVIEPADMPELQYMRWIVLAIAAASWVICRYIEIPLRTTTRQFLSKALLLRAAA